MTDQPEINVNITDDKKLTLAIKAAKVTFMVEASREGKTLGIQPVDVNVFEAQFGSTLEALVAALLEQANRSLESAAEGGDSKE